MSKPKLLPPKDTIEKYVKYDPDTGLFYSKLTNKQVGCLDKSRGYVCIFIQDRKLAAHRVAYFLFTGEQPLEIDHVNGIKHDNRISNLLASNRNHNQKNQKKFKTNTTGITGVTKHRDGWLVEIGGKLNRRRKVFDNFDEAVKVRKQWEQELNYRSAR